MNRSVFFLILMMGVQLLVASNADGEILPTGLSLASKRKQTVLQKYFNDQPMKHGKDHTYGELAKECCQDSYRCFCWSCKNCVKPCLQAACNECVKPCLNATARTCWEYRKPIGGCFAAWWMLHQVFPNQGQAVALVPGSSAGMV